MKYAVHLLQRSVLQLLLAVLCILAPSASIAVDAHLKWVEVEVTLSPEMKAMVQYKVCWNVRGGTMGGFYFQGERGDIAWNRRACGAVVNGEKRYDLDLRDLGNRWDVLLANRQRFGPGEIIYVLTYFSNYQAAGHLIRTTAADQQQLVAFDWAPVQWDEPLEHETVLVEFPLIVNKAELTLEETAPLGLRTEPFVNERYKLSYLGLPGSAVGETASPDAPLHLAIRAHRDRLAARETFPLKLYVPEAIFAAAPAAEAPAIPAPHVALDAAPQAPFSNLQAPPVVPLPQNRPPAPVSQGFFPQTQSSRFGLHLKPGFFLLVLAGIAFLIIRMKHQSVLKAAQRFDEIQWDRDDWVAPKIELKTFRNNGKIARLDPIEAG